MFLPSHLAVLITTTVHARGHAPGPFLHRQTLGREAGDGGGRQRVAGGWRGDHLFVVADHSPLRLPSKETDSRIPERVFSLNQRRRPLPCTSSPVRLTRVAVSPRVISGWGRGPLSSRRLPLSLSVREFKRGPWAGVILSLAFCPSFCVRGVFNDRVV